MKLALKATLEYSDYWANDGPCDVLGCPRCDCGQTHLEVTEVFQRPEDGEPRSVMIGAAVEVIEGPSDVNPSPRRDAVVLHFRGECGHTFTVTFMQHKGETFAWTDKGVY